MVRFFHYYYARSSKSVYEHLKKNNNTCSRILPFDFFGLIFYLYNLHDKSIYIGEKVKMGFKAWHIALSFSQVLIKSESMRRSK